MTIPRLCVTTAVILGLLVACGDAPSADGLTPQDQEKLDVAAQKLDARRAGLPDRDAQDNASAAE